MIMRLKSFTLVGLQFLFIILLISGVSFNRHSIPAYTLISLSVFLAGWAIFSMRKSKLRIIPEPSRNATLITDGPYQFIRHPMYTAVIAGAAGLVLFHFTWVRLLILLSLIIVLIIKLLWEEKMLVKRFDSYQQYMKQTNRLIPFIF